MDIKTQTELRTVYEQPLDVAVRKELSFIDKHARDFIGRAPFMVLSTCDAAGWPDASPRGDAPGFVTVVDDKRIEIPDRPGNNRLDSLQNLLSNPRVGLLFLVPGRLETLRLNGTARMTTEPALLQKHAINGRPARSVIEVTATSVYFQCGKAVIRSALWQKERWPSLDGLATFGEALADQVSGTEKAAMEERLATAYRDRLY